MSVFEAKGLFYKAGESGGGTTDYEDLTNKPQINGVTLSGNKTSADLGIKGSVQIAIESTTPVQGYVVPSPTAEEMTAIYNAIVAGSSVHIVDSNDVYYQVLQADSVDDAINIEALYFGELALLYTLENDTVTITWKKLGGTVESVNGKTGVVVLDAEDVGATTKNVITLTGDSGTLTAEQIAQVQDDTAVLEIVCDGEVFRLSNKDSTLTYRTFINTNCEASETVSFKVIYVQLNEEAVNYGAWSLEEVSAGQTIQVDTLPTATAGELGRVYQFVGTTDSTYTNGYFYKCVSDGQDPATYSWTRVDVQPGSSLPSQSGNAGKFLTTDGTAASWETVNALQNNTTEPTSLSIGGTSITYSEGVAVGMGAVINGSSVSVGYHANVQARNVSIGYFATSDKSYGGSIAIGYQAKADITPADWSASIAIGPNAVANADGAIQICSANILNDNVNKTNSDANTFKVANENGNFEIMSADGTVPTDRLVHAINKYSTMPTAAAGNEGWIVQFTGTTSSTYTHGHLYECVSNGETPATYSWEEVSMGSGGGLPDQTGNAGKFLTTNGTDASWSDKPLVNMATGYNGFSIGVSSSGYEAFAINGTANQTRGMAIGSGSIVYSSDSMAIGRASTVQGQYSTSIGDGSIAYGQGSLAIGRNAGAGLMQSGDMCAIAIGPSAKARAVGAIQIGGTYANIDTINSDANTFKVANANGNFEIMDANGNLPADRLASTTGLADGNYRLRLTMSNGVPTLSWVAE